MKFLRKKNSKIIPIAKVCKIEEYILKVIMGYSVSKNYKNSHQWKICKFFNIPSAVKNSRNIW